MQAISLADRLVWIPPGQFRMGSPEVEEGRFLDESPVNDASIPHGFWMERYGITQQRYRDLMSENLSSTEFCLNCQSIALHGMRRWNIANG